MSELIPAIIEEEEILVRSIVYPLMYSKSKKRLKEIAFRPPANRNDVSVLRLSYTSANFCKKHSKSLVIGNHTYCGMALIKVKDVRRVSVEQQQKYSDGTSALANVQFTPLDENNNIVKPPVFKKDKGLPMHADIVYNFSPVKGEAIPVAVRKIARALAKQPPAKFYEDEQPEIEHWVGELII